MITEREMIKREKEQERGGSKRFIRKRQRRKKWREEKGNFIK